MAALRSPPSWWTSLGALVAIVVAGTAAVVEYGRARERVDQSAIEIQRVWEGIRAESERTKTDLRREIDLACRCCR